MMIIGVEKALRKARVRMSVIESDRGARLGPIPVCAECCGNISRGGFAAGRYVRIDTSGLTDEPCYYCGSENALDVEYNELEQVLDLRKKHYNEAEAREAIRDHNLEFHDGNPVARGVWNRRGSKGRNPSPVAFFCVRCIYEKRLDGQREAMNKKGDRNYAEN